MEETTIVLKDLLSRTKTDNPLFKRNILKVYLQVLVLDFIYSNPEYDQMCFYGGSCLAHLYGLNRLSEDLDFVDINKNVDISKLSVALQNYFNKNTDLKAVATIQKFRICLKFPILQELGLSGQGDTNQLYLKVEVYKDWDFFKNYKTEIMPLFEYNKSILVKTFDLPTFMATKIAAVLNRKWERKSANGEILAAVKGRDYFDLMWYLQKGVKPNLDCIKNIKNMGELKQALLEVIEKVDSRSIINDLEPFIESTNFVKNLGKNIKDILKREVTSM